MINAEKFKQVFGLTATELWAKPEQEFLAWLNLDTDKIVRCENCKYFAPFDGQHICGFCIKKSDIYMADWCYCEDGEAR